jgi:hypothetical protein
MPKTTPYDPIRPWLVQKTAAIHGVTASYVYKILAGERENEEIFCTYMDLLEGANNLIEQVKNAVPL